MTVLHRLAYRMLQAVALLCLSASLAATAAPPQVTPALRAELAPSGTLRAAINYGNSVLAQKDAKSGELRGVSVDLATELGRRLGLPVKLVPFDAAGKVFDGLKGQAWDVAFLAVDPVRATGITFTAPYVVIEGSYLVAADSPLQRIEDVDRDGIRVSVGRHSAYDLYLTRSLKHAQLIRASTSPDALRAFQNDKLEVAAGVRQPLVEFARGHPEVRLINGAFMRIEQAMGTPRGREAGARYLHQFVEEMKESGFIARGLSHSGQADATIAPAAPRQ